LVALTIGSGRVKITPTSYTASSDIYDARYGKDSGTLSMAPPPKAGATSAPTVVSATSRLTPLLVSEGINPLFPFLPPVENEQDTTYRIEARARIAQSALVDANSLLSLSDGERAIVVGQDWKTYTADVKTDTSIAQLYVGAWRGAFGSFLPSGSPTSLLDNDDVDYTIEFDFVRAYPINHNSERIRVYIPSDSGRQEIPCYRVDDASVYKDGLPPTIALYDSSGRVCVSPIYNNIVIDANGGEESINMSGALNKMSILATGRSAVDRPAGAYPSVGMVLIDQKPAIEHIEEAMSSSDYFYTENLTDSNITVRRRFNYQEYPTDFSIDNLESASRSGSELREQKYIVHYDRDYSDDSLSNSVESNQGSNSDVPVRTLVTVLKSEDDAQYVADLMPRDSSDNGVYTTTMLGIGQGHEVGDAGVITDVDIPPNRPAIIRKIKESTETRITAIDAKILQRTS